LVFRGLPSRQAWQSAFKGVRGADSKESRSRHVGVGIASNEKEFYNLHSSTALGEGINPFPSDQKSLKFSVNNNSHWEANCDAIDNVEEEKWIAAGRPNDGEKYDKIFKRKDGKEYKINLDKFSGTRLKISVGLREAKEEAHFPDKFDFKSWAN
jgi:hypothetical protein